MDHSGQPSEGSSLGVQAPEPARLHYESEDEMKSSKYQVLWSNLMDKGNYKKPSGYLKVAVLLLCWDQDCVDMETQEEVEGLKEVFEKKFGYSVTTFELSTENGGLQVQVNAEVAVFVKNHNGQNTLLIIYYAGHGKPSNRFGQLEVFGFVLQMA